ncbi:MAG TPA: hypothetical protein VNN72_08665 [Polyangiaceae bacterium]|nr:hypothetical protein [Polyangiaceae bacterium]
MNRDPLLALVKWLIGPLAVMAVTGTLAAWVAGEQRGTLFGRTAKLTPAQREELEVVPFLSVANATWRLGNWSSAKKAVKAELDHLPDSGAARARALLRFAALDDNPEGQAAVAGQACAADPSICDHLKDAVERETSLRLLSPGNSVPLYFLGGHPRIPGAGHP